MGNSTFPLAKSGVVPGHIRCIHIDKVYVDSETQQKDECNVNEGIVGRDGKFRQLTNVINKQKSENKILMPKEIAYVTTADTQRHKGKTKVKSQIKVNVM